MCQSITKGKNIFPNVTVEQSTIILSVNCTWPTLIPHRSTLLYTDIIIYYSLTPRKTVCNNLTHPIEAKVPKIIQNPPMWPSVATDHLDA
jgi:hypothetical protein